MAVFPDRIVLKNSTDSEASIVSAIGSGGTDAIQPGELVIGRESSAAKLYTLDSTGSVVIVAGGAGGGGGGLAYWGGGDFTTGTSDGQPADGGDFN